MITRPPEVHAWYLRVADAAAKLPSPPIAGAIEEHDGFRFKGVEWFCAGEMGTVRQWELIAPDGSEVGISFGTV